MNSEDKMIKILRRVPPYLRSQRQKECKKSQPMEETLILRILRRWPGLRLKKRMILYLVPFWILLRKKRETKRNGQEANHLLRRLIVLLALLHFLPVLSKVANMNPSSFSESSYSRPNVRFKCFLWSDDHLYLLRPLCAVCSVHEIPPTFPVLGDLCSLTPGESHSFPQFFFDWPLPHQPGPPAFACFCWCPVQGFFGDAACRLPHNMA